MPRMDGLSFLAKLMQHAPMPVVVVSSLAQAQSDAALRALSLGAAGVVAKPTSAYSVEGVGAELVRAVRAASRVPPSALVPRVPGDAGSQAPLSGVTGRALTHRVIALGASTGGPNALESVLKVLPQATPGIVICQHMPPVFTTRFAERLNSVCEIEVREAVTGDRIEPGLALIAPGGVHMRVLANGAHWVVDLRDGPAVHHQKPAVDVLFTSVAKAVGGKAVGALLTGMGADGAAGMLAMRSAGAHTIAQDEASCVIFGMPKAAIDAGAVVDILPLGQIAPRLLKAVTRSANKQLVTARHESA
jgi:two-component system, chemotaxis family, protein-glutamate methylesterase/glutaminase